jgi:hypothetical protein
MNKSSTRNRWIMYAHQDNYGGQSFRVTAHESLQWCKASLEEFSRALMEENVSATLYAYSDEAWRSAREYEDIGCPFDYPDYVIKRGPRGAFTI